MVEASWGEEDEPGRFGLLGDDLTNVDSDRPEDVPAVAAAGHHDFHPAPEAPLWYFVPALWARDSRSWVRDVRVRHLVRQCDDGPALRVP